MESNHLNAEPLDDDYPEIAAWVDGEMTDPLDRDLFEARLRLDPHLRAQVADLTAFKAGLAGLPARRHEPVENVLAFCAPSALRWALPFAAAAAVVAAMWISSAAQPAVDPTVRAALAGHGIPLPPLPSELRRERGVLAGESDPIALQALSPLGRFVRERRPTLTWQTTGPADAYSVQLQRIDGGVLISSPPLPPAARSWRPPEPLAPGAIYEWQVQAMKNGSPVDQAPRPPEPEARFKVIDAAAESALQTAERAPRRDPLALGLAYARAGLPDEADHAWSAAGPLGQRLRAELRKQSVR